MHPAVQKYNKLPSIGNELSWQNASETARKKAQSRAVIVRHLLTQECALPKAFEALVNAYRTNTAMATLSTAIDALGKLPGRATIYNWCNAYKDNGINGLLPNHKGKAQTQYSWLARSLELYHSPNSPSFAQVADQLNKEGYKAEHHQVRRFINGLPHELGPQSPYRMGAKLYREKHKDHLLRSTDNLKPGVMYNGDGHTLDVYLAHPKTGKPYRAELTAFQDVASRCIVGWELGYAESTLDTLAAISRAIKVHNNVPAMFYLDNGSGYKNKLMNDDTTGFYAQFEIDVIFAIPGNARVKWIERFFLHMEDRVGKRFSTYCGRDHDDRHKQLVLKEAKQGKRKLPTVDEWIAEFKAFLNDYHNSEHPEVKGKTRQQVWDENIERVPPVEGDFVMLPRETVNIRRGRFRLHQRDYSADFLHQFNGQELVAAYDLHDDSYTKLYKLNGEFLMFANLKTKSHAVPTSRIEQAESKRRTGRLKRIDTKRREIEAQENQERIIDVDSVAKFAAPIKGIEAQEAPVNIFDFDVTPAQPQHEIDLNELLDQPNLRKETTYEL
ncbi:MULTISPECIES: Mu transposase C-terminal domain-containing protein [unclassified Pseudoalteromonas]|uniref:Mu transposase C-terminal domain-containing protein n=1 Tax=unclassified Pseudoalteromonas TaxID=194690 RepID=UPI00235A2CCE|nr:MULTISPECIES: Mu transposase C-terminal domain-containing protein [unclassified Pseudoalteromonas]MDC9565862.1 Mu transposase C-terminal domain-containing protein [Pseudoalteromonas sp. GAB2316C]MDC9570195.1 Mu transposase C-terminal domain-containing protein [Pseudoalteromonas sp. GABNB9D]MDC9574385.1 Mu transposase C-terminal domain-containing protein [Pseudoalteromonas sp. GABNS16A]MDC9586276.1 Mu transposase C-terminal domain-containing protein [Pseudoalteromonas sp. GABNS16C]MDC9601717